MSSHDDEREDLSPADERIEEGILSAQTRHRAEATAAFLEAEEASDADFPDEDDDFEKKATPQPPHPGFGMALGWCFVFLIAAQIIPSMVIAVGALAVEAIASGNADAYLKQVTSKEGMEAFQSRLLLPLMFVAQVAGILVSLLILRLVAGRDWARQVGLRLPSVSQLVLVVLGFPSLPILASGAYLIAKDHIPGLPDLPALLIAQFGAMFLVWLVVRLGFGPDWNLELIACHPGRQIVLALMMLVGAVLLTHEFFLLLGPHVVRIEGAEKGMMEEMVQEFRSWPVWLGVLIIGLGPGLGEELWCRGFLGRGLLGHYGYCLGVLLASYLFGLIHLDPHQGTMAALMGVVLHLSYLATRSLLVPMLLHFANNSLAIVAPLLGKELEKIDTAPQEILLPVYVAAGLLMMAVAWALYRSRPRLVRTDGTGLPPWQPDFPGVFHPPADSGTRLVYPWPGWLPSLLVLVAVAAFVGSFLLPMLWPAAGVQQP